MSEQSSIYSRLRNRLVNGEFLPRQRLSAKIIRKDYGCSASNIREILFRLSTIGLVEFQEQRGFRLPEHSLKRQHELTHFRIMLESEGACLSARLGGIAWEARLSAAHHMLSHIESKVRQNQLTEELVTIWADSERKFHQTLIDSCDSTVLKRAHEIIYHQFRQQLIYADRQYVFVPENIPQHHDILTAALAHDESLLRKRIHTHLSRHLLNHTQDSATESLT